MNHERNAKIVALVTAPGFQMFTARNGTITMLYQGHAVTCKSVDACFDAFIFAMESIPDLVGLPKCSTDKMGLCKRVWNQGSSAC